MRAITAILLLTASSVVSAANLLAQYENVLHGKAAFDQATLDSMYSAFRAQFTSLPSQHYSQDNRKAVFEETVKRIIEHNTNVEALWKKGLNEYSDMTETEFFDYFNIRAEQNCSATTRPQASQNIEEILRGVPNSWNWKDFGVVTPVKNQGKCGSCWTFSTVGCLESHYMMKYSSFRNLSEQQLVDCAGAFENYGCKGGLPSHAFEYILSVGGITDEGSYPYVANTSTCRP